MQTNVPAKAAPYTKQNRLRRAWRKLVRVMACIVVFCTTYAMILPAITMQHKTICGVSEHTHSLLCYVQLTSKTVTELTCTYESLGVHVHTAACLDETGEPVCGYADYLVHTHDERCGDACTLPQISAHTHSDACYNIHAHDEACYTTVTGALVCELHVHGDECYDPGEPVCGLTEDVHPHEESCYAPTLICTEADHTHAEGCYETEQVLSCGLEEVTAEDAELTCGRKEAILHSHGSDCYETVTDELGTEQNVLICGMTALESHSHSETCFTTREIPLDNLQTLTCTVTDENHLHIERCYGTWAMICGTEEHTHVESCYPAEPEPEYDCGLTEHAHDDGCYDTEGVLQCTLEPHSHAESDCALAVDQDVAYVIDLIENIPSAEEIEAKLAEFEAAGDDEGEEAWYAEVSQQVAQAYHYYNALTEEDKALVTNAEKLLGLEHIWSVKTYAADYTTNIHWVDYYDFEEGLKDKIETSAVVFANKPVNSFGYYYWTGFVVEREGAHFRVKEVLPYGETKPSRTPSAAGYIVLIFSDVMSRAAVGDYVAFNGFYPDHHYGPSVSGYGSVTFSKTPMVASQAPEVENYTSTSAFVNLNLYDYHGDINANGYTDINTRFLAKQTAYPGFQWNGGAYPYRYRKDAGLAVQNPDRDWIASRYYVDCLDFGNSYITDYGLDAYFTSTFDDDELVSGTPWYRGYKTGGSIAVAKADGSNGLINGIVFGEIYNQQSNTDHPIGVSTKYASIGKTLAYDVNGYYPQLGYTATPYGESLRYLFDAAHPGQYAEKKNTQNIDGLFQKDPVTGAYYYDSRKNHAQFNTATSKFVLYKQVITPNYILYPFGNFMPLNDITDPGGATQVSAFNYQGGVKTYFESVMREIEYKANLTKSEIQLFRMLRSYRYNWENWTNPKRGDGRKWPDISATNTLNDYFDNSSEFGGDGIDFYDTDLQNLLTKVYNIDYNVAKNFFFGMDMSMSFVQPKGGLAGNDNNADGTPDYPMEFYFAGDDDVWVFIDKILFLDLTGIHRHVGGKIDFVNGKVYYYAMDSYVNGAVKDTPYYSMTFAEILTKHGGIAEADLGKYLKKDGSGNYTTFLDYSNHQFNFYYMERGSGSSVCRINFNFPLLKQNTLSVEKELTADAAIKALGNPDFRFQVLDVDNNGNKTNKSFFAQNDDAGSQWAYSLYDADGSVIQEIKVIEENPDGTVKTLEVRNGAGQLLRRETQDANGNAQITDYPENGSVLTIDSNGVFTLKAGQRAEFIGVSENWGKCFVRELIDPKIVEQYGTIAVNGSASSLVNGVTVNDQTFTGIDSPIMDMSGGSTRFLFNNKITSAKLGELTITKILAPVYSGVTDKTFRFRVTLDGAPLPAGTKYTVGSTEKTVVIEDGFSYVELKPGQTAVISKILAGTRFEVVEVLASTDDYIVGYTVGGEAREGSASGVIGLDQTVAVNVTNSERGAAVKIPVTKGYYYYGTVDRVSHFNLVRVTDATGMEMVGDTLTATMTVSTEEVTLNALFTLNYLEKDLDFGDGDTLVYYYRLTEDNTILPGSTLPNYKVFVYQVTLTKTASGVSSAITGIWSGTADINGKPTGTLEKLEGTPTATFMNTIYGPLTVGKVVDGSDGCKQSKFTFEIILNTTYRGKAPLPATLPAVITRVTEGGTVTEDTTVALSYTDGTETRKSCTVELAHNETITINQIPYYATWSVTELNVPENVEVSYVIYKGSEEISSANASKPVGYILVGGHNVAKVVFTNKENYVLPATGGNPISYTMAGWMLMLFSAAYLLYTHSKCRKEAV